MTPNELEAENTRLRTQLLETQAANARAVREKEETHARVVAEHAERDKRSAASLQKLAMDLLRGEAKAAGARPASLPELEVVLRDRIAHDDENAVFIKGPDGTPVMIQGRRQTIPEFVKDYLHAHPHHLEAAPRRPGPSLHLASVTSLEAARERYERGDRSPAAIQELFAASRQQRGA